MAVNTVQPEIEPTRTGPEADAAAALFDRLFVDR